jgi:hypothetical protein
MKVYYARHNIISPINIDGKMVDEQVDTEHHYTIGSRVYIYSVAHQEYTSEPASSTKNGDEISLKAIIHKDKLIRYIWQ